MDRKIKTCLISFLFLTVLTNTYGQDSLSHIPKAYKETALTIGYNYNFGDKVNGKRPKPFDFIELGVWRTTASLVGHHPFYTTYYFSNDFGLNTDDDAVPMRQHPLSSPNISR